MIEFNRDLMRAIKKVHNLINKTTFICIALCINVSVFSCDGIQKTLKDRPLKIISTTRAGNVPYGLYVENEYAYITNNNDLVIFDVHDPEDPEKVGAISTGVTFSLTVRDGLVYTVGDKGCIIDVSNPSKPLMIAELPMRGTGHSIWVEDTFAYITTSEGLEIVDISYPARPSRVSHCSEGPARGIVCVDGIAFVANRINGLEIIDVKIPSAPQKIKTLPGTEAAWHVHRYQDYLFLARHGYGVEIYDIEERNNPQLIGRFCDDDEGEALSVWGDSDYLYVADNFGVEVLDITDPAHPMQIEELGGLGCTHDIVVKGTLLFIASVKKGLIILDFTPE